MQRATTIIRKAAVKPERVVDSVILAHEDRQRRRAVLKTAKGTEVLLDLDKAGILSEGDALKLDDGGLVTVTAAPEALLEIRAESPLRLMRVAWHIGNRHTPAEVTADAIYIEDDHVLAEMIRGQGCSITRVTKPFQPERGAYDHGGHGHGHDHDHHDHDHDHGHPHGHHTHANPPHGQPGHVHGPDCGHDHTHDVLTVGSHDHGHDHGHHHHDHDHKHHHGHDHGHAPRAKHDH